MPKKSLLSLEGEDIVIHGLDTIVNFTRFHPVNVNLFLDGLELADDLKADAGTILYTKNTEISHERIAKLLKLRESNANLDFNFQIKRNEKLLNKFREELKERMLTLLKRRQATKVFKDLMVGVANSIESFYDILFEDEEILLALYRIRFICVSAESQRSIFYADHAINMSLFALAIAESRKMEEAIGKNKEKSIEIVKASLFHNFGALLEIDEILQLPANERPQKYWEANLKGLDKITSLKFSYELMMGIRGLCDYHAGRRDFIPKLEGSELLANILVVADVFLQSESGLFGEPVEARTVVDKMNVKAMGKELNDVVIQALTLGLNLTDIFDFYSELERLKSKCPYESAVPYPLTGFNSPTIFVCKKRVTKCQYLEVSVKAVNLITKLGELQSGEYNRCKLLTPSLMSFYDEHYEEIKESTTEKPKGQAAAKPGAAPKTGPSSKPLPKAADAKPAAAEAAKPAQAEKQEKS
ncbi:MAG: hypothetical protein JXQ83_05470 [Candidatus Glassbacteria bacterium]|nr:hypothetical protein [Candidatus Glassbacteria bacterium]